VNEAGGRAVNVRDEKERDRHDNRQDQKQGAFPKKELICQEQEYRAKLPPMITGSNHRRADPGFPLHGSCSPPSRWAHCAASKAPGAEESPA